MFKLLILFTIILNQAYAAKIIINVGAYQFPPYFEIKQDKSSGFTKEVIKILNELQSEIHFKLYITNANRRYQDFESNKFQMMMFENLAWGWASKKLDKKLNQSSILMTGGEVFITSKTKKKDQTYFKSMTDKTMIGVLGYHYKFAGFNSNQEYLKKNHRMVLTTTQDSIIKAVAVEHIDIGIITKEYLVKFLKENPSFEKKILISDRYDQIYEHRIIFRKETEGLAVSFMEDLIRKLKLHPKFIELQGIVNDEKNSPNR